MKKNLVLLCASAMLLAGCGESGTNYVAEPSGGKTVESSVISEAARKLSTNLATKKAIGLSAEEEGKINGSLSMRNLPQLGAMAGKAYKVDLDEKVNGSIALGSFGEEAKGSASLSGSLKGTMTIPTLKSFDPTTMSMEVEDKEVNLDADLSAKAYLDGGAVYGDLSGLKEGVSKIANVVSSISGQKAEIPDVFGKYKLALPEEFVTTLATLPETLTSYVGLAAQFLGAFEDFKATVEDENAKKLLAAIEFKSYDGGLFGIHAKTDLKSILSLIPTQEEAQSMINKVLEKVDASAEALILFSETELTSAGLTFKVDIKDLDFASFGEAESMPFDKLNLSVDFGTKVAFSYNDAVQIETLSDKESYKDIALPAADDYED